MIIVNGTIQGKLMTGGGLNMDGYPVKPSEALCDKIPCRVKVNKKDNLGKQNGNTFTIASYEVLIDTQPFDTERVKLTEHGRDLGEFSVLWTEYLEAVNALKIVV
jgi:hypothetical protein